MTAGMLGILTSMNVYALKTARMINRSSTFSGSALGIASCACAGCSSLGVIAVSTFGSLGAAAFAFLGIYQIPLRLASLAVLAWAYYSVKKTIGRNIEKDSEGLG
jgi:hypothetical protein